MGGSCPKYPPPRFPPFFPVLPPFSPRFPPVFPPFFPVFPRFSPFFPATGNQTPIGYGNLSMRMCDIFTRSAPAQHDTKCYPRVPCLGTPRRQGLCSHFNSSLLCCIGVWLGTSGMAVQMICISQFVFVAFCPMFRGRSVSPPCGPWEHVPPHVWKNSDASSSAATQDNGRDEIEVCALCC